MSQCLCYRGVSLFVATNIEAGQYRIINSSQPFFKEKGARYHFTDHWKSPKGGKDRMRAL